MGIAASDEVAKISELELRGALEQMKKEKESLAVTSNEFEMALDNAEKKLEQKDL